MTEKVTAGIGKGTPGPGRPPGVPNKATKTLKAAILEAASAAGQDGKGKGGLVGWLKSLAVNDAKAFASLLGRVLPLQVDGPGENGEHFVQAVERRIVKQVDANPQD